MRVFLTGASGYIGGAVASALRKNGHDVAALVRPDADTRRLRGAGVVLVAGDLSSMPSLAGTLDKYDVLVHTAFASKDPVAMDRTAVDVFSAARRHFIYTSGVWVLGNTTNANESTPVNPLALVAWRPAHEKLAIESGGAVLRPGCVYGGKQSLLAGWFAAAEEGRAITIAGDGKNRWALVNLHDLADLYVRTVEQKAKGVLHGIDDTHASLDECARALTGKIEHVEPDRQKLGPFADALVVDEVVSSSETRRKVGWSPKRTFTGSIDEQRREYRASR
ncbi:MAG TPA: NAD-dependent epimerase/dehydratase family protein [Thermoanaerobaculia bacterium]|nr:NAD-dependent epimerase/dehydratase family protein [Thermoanaerobaculia bacterium]